MRLTSGGIDLPLASFKAGTFWALPKRGAAAPPAAANCGSEPRRADFLFASRRSKNSIPGTARNASANTSGTTIKNSPSVLMILPPAIRSYAMRAKNPAAQMTQIRFSNDSSRFICFLFDKFQFVVDLKSPLTLKRQTKVYQTLSMFLGGLRRPLGQ